MSTIEQWVHWKPLNDLVSRYDLEIICNDAEGFKIILFESNDPNKKLAIIFNNLVYSYKVTDETYTNALISDLDELYGKDFYVNWTFFEIINSKYLKDMSTISSGLIDYVSCKHYVIFTSDVIIEFLTEQHPKFKFFSEK